MRRLTVFNQMSLDGYFTDAKGDISWAHKSDPEWDAFVVENAKAGGELVFGRVTYEMMVAYWPTPKAAQDNPDLAKQMNDLPKVVVSKTLSQPSWANTKVIKSDLEASIRKLKQEPGNDLVILGSGSLVSQLTGPGLIDEYQLVVNPIVLGRGRTMFDGLNDKVPLTLTKSRAFKNGNMLTCYQRAQ